MYAKPYMNSGRQLLHVRAQTFFEHDSRLAGDGARANMATVAVLISDALRD